MKCVYTHTHTHTHTQTLMWHLCVCVCVKLSRFSCVWLIATLWTIAHQAPLSMDSPGKNTRVGFYSLLQGIFQAQGSNLSLLCLLALAGRYFTPSATWEVHTYTHRKTYMCLKHNLVCMGNSEGIKDCWECDKYIWSTKLWCLIFN